MTGMLWSQNFLEDALQLCSDTRLAFSHNNCVGVVRIVRPHLDYTEHVHCNEFARKKLCLSRNSFVVSQST